MKIAVLKKIKNKYFETNYLSWTCKKKQIEMLTMIILFNCITIIKIVEGGWIQS